MTGIRQALDATLAALPDLRTWSKGTDDAGPGSAACRAIAEVYDRELAARFEAASAGQALALVATGGWARKELAPYSDIDFIVLHDRDEAGSQRRRAIACSIPCGTRSSRSGIRCASRARSPGWRSDDLATATALLDARHIAGDRRLTSAS